MTSEAEEPSSPSAHGNTYPSLPLDKDSRQIRILRLHPGRDDALRGTLRVASLTDQPCYEALSYTWGRSTYEPQPCIILNENCNLPLTDNLYHALTRLRRSRRSRDMWIDAICINQSDTDERGHQVSFMGEVYREARQVCVWLGDVHIASPRRRVLAHMLPPDWFDHVPRRLRAAIWEKVCRLLSPRELALAVATSYPRWHQRAWTYQELVNARKLNWCFGPIERSKGSRVLGEYLSASYHHGRLSLPCRLDPDAGIYLRFLGDHLVAAADMMSSTANKKTLLQHSECIVRMRASDPRDKIFSIKGVVPPSEAKFISTDYSKSLALVFAEATFASIAGSKFLDALCYADCTYSDRSVELPTWAIDFDMWYICAHPLSINLDEISHFHCPARWHAARPRLGQCQNQLHLTVKHFGPILRISSGIQLGPFKPFDDWGTLLGRLFHSDESGDPVRSHSLGRAASGSHGGDSMVNKCELDDQIVLSRSKAAMNWLQKEMQPAIHRALLAEPEGSTIEVLLMRYLAWNRCCPGETCGKAKLFSMSQDYLGIGPIDTAPGDIVAFTDSMTLPLLLRPEGDAYSFVGFAYIGPGDRTAQINKILEDVEPQEVALV